MAVTPAGILSVPLDAAAELVAQSAAFQAWVGASSQADARRRIYLVARSSKGIEKYERPYALVMLPENHRWVTGMGAFAIGSQITILFEADTNPLYRGSDSHQDAAIDFINAIGQIVQEMTEVNQGSGPLQFDQIAMDGPIQRSNGKDGDEDYFNVLFRVTAGFR